MMTRRNVELVRVASTGSPWGHYIDVVLAFQWSPFIELANWSCGRIATTIGKAADA